MTPTEAALAAARAAVKASSGTRLPMDTGRDTPAEELWGALLNLRAALAALDAGAGEDLQRGCAEAITEAADAGYAAGIEAAIQAAESTEEYSFSVAVKMAPADHLACAVSRIRALSPAPSAAPTTKEDEP